MKEIFFFPTYPTKKYRVGIQQTNKFWRMAKYGITCISFKLHKKNYQEFEWKSNKKSYFPVFPILSISKDGNYW